MAGCLPWPRPSAALWRLLGGPLVVGMPTSLWKPEVSHLAPAKVGMLAKQAPLGTGARALKGLGLGWKNLNYWVRVAIIAGFDSWLITACKATEAENIQAELKLHSQGDVTELSRLSFLVTLGGKCCAWRKIGWTKWVRFDWWSWCLHGDASSKGWDNIHKIHGDMNAAKLLNQMGIHLESSLLESIREVSMRIHDPYLHCAVSPGSPLLPFCSVQFQNFSAPRGGPRRFWGASWVLLAHCSRRDWMTGLAESRSSYRLSRSSGDIQTFDMFLVASSCFVSWFHFMHIDTNNKPRIIYT